MVASPLTVSLSASRGALRRPHESTLLCRGQHHFSRERWRIKRGIARATLDADNLVLRTPLPIFPLQAEQAGTTGPEDRRFGRRCPYRSVGAWRPLTHPCGDLPFFPHGILCFMWRSDPRGGIWIWAFARAFFFPSPSAHTFHALFD